VRTEDQEIRREEAEGESMKLTTEQASLLLFFGVYGAWLLKHGREIGKLSDSTERTNLMNVYEMYHRHPDHPTAGMLMGTIDCFCTAHKWETPISSYPEEMEELRNLPERDEGE
jgi:hypothetical protein